MQPSVFVLLKFYQCSLIYTCHVVVEHNWGNLTPIPRSEVMPFQKEECSKSSDFRPIVSWGCFLPFAKTFCWYWTLYLARQVGVFQAGVKRVDFLFKFSGQNSVQNFLWIFLSGWNFLFVSFCHMARKCAYFALQIFSAALSGGDFCPPVLTEINWSLNPAATAKSLYTLVFYKRAQVSILLFMRRGRYPTRAKCFCWVKSGRCLPGHSSCERVGFNPMWLSSQCNVALLAPYCWSREISNV